MKRNFLKHLIFVFICAIVTISCNHNDYTNEDQLEVNHAVVVSNFEKTFVNAFGTPSASWSWDYTLANSHKIMTRGSSSTPSLSEWPRESYNNYGYTWKYATGNDDPMKENVVADIFHNDLSDLIALINEAPVLDWNPTGTIIFRPIATYRTTDNDAKYFSVGADLGSNNWYLRQSHVKKKTNGTFLGNTSGQHTSAIDFDEVNTASTVLWFASVTDGKKDSFDPATYTLTTFKEVTYTASNGNTYVFWCFNCEDGGTYADYIWWVDKVNNTPTYKYSKRYFVEDLGGADNGDIDFNDIVFDIVEYTNGTQECIVRALGGTLPITINVCGTSWSKPTAQVPNMINTGVDGAIDYGKVIASFTVSGWDPDSNAGISVNVQDKDGFNFVTEFPRNGAIPFMVAFSTAKEWNVERIPVTSEWLELNN